MWTLIQNHFRALTKREKCRFNFPLFPYFVYKNESEFWVRSARRRNPDRNSSGRLCFTLYWHHHRSDLPSSFFCPFWIGLYFFCSFHVFIFMNGRSTFLFDAFYSTKKRGSLSVFWLPKNKFLIYECLSYTLSICVPHLQMERDELSSKCFNKTTVVDEGRIGCWQRHNCIICGEMVIFSPLRRTLWIVSTSSLEHSKWINVAVYHRLMHQATTPKINLSGNGIVEENRWKTEKIRDWKTNKQKTQNIIRLCLWRAKPLKYRHFFSSARKLDPLLSQDRWRAGWLVRHPFIIPLAFASRAQRSYELIAHNIFIF